MTLSHRNKLTPENNRERKMSSQRNTPNNPRQFLKFFALGLGLPEISRPVFANVKGYKNPTMCACELLIVDMQ